MKTRTNNTAQTTLAGKVQRYWDLTRLIAEARRSAAALHDELVAALAGASEPIDVEGVPTLRLVDRRAGPRWDVESLAEREPREFRRLLELGCLSVGDKVADAQVQAGNLSGTHRQFGWGTTSQALVFDNRVRPSRGPAP